MAMGATEIEKQALDWLRQHPDQRVCQHHWAQASGLTSPEHEQALGGLLRSIRTGRKKYSEFAVEDRDCTYCATKGDNSTKPVFAPWRGAPLKTR